MPKKRAKAEKPEPAIPAVAPGLGRPSLYTPALAAEICERIAGGESLRAVCRDDAMPNVATVVNWLADQRKAEFLAQYMQARERQADCYADEIVEIADAAVDVQLGRLRMDARKWVASKLRPKRYGDRIVNEHTGENGGPVEVSGPPAALDIARRLLAMGTRVTLERVTERVVVEDGTGRKDG